MTALADALEILILTTSAPPMTVGAEILTFGGRGGISLEFREKETLVTSVAEHTNCTVDPEHTVVLIGVRVNAAEMCVQCQRKKCCFLL